MKLLVLLFFFLGCVKSESSTNSTPVILFKYTKKYDNECNDVSEEMRKELVRMIPQFEKIWNKNGVSFVTSLVKTMKKDFKNKQINAELSLCGKKSFAFPLKVNVRKRILNKIGKGPAPKDTFENTVIHELLHIWIADNFILDNQLLKEFKNKYGYSDTVLVHLHHIALNIYILKNENEFKKIDHLEAMYKIFGGDYLKAWNLIQDEKIYNLFLSDLKDSNTYRKRGDAAKI